MYIPSSDGWHLPLLQSNVQLLEDVPPCRPPTVALYLPGGKKYFSMKHSKRAGSYGQVSGKVSLSMWYTVTVVVHLAVCGLQMTFSDLSI